MNKHSTKSQNIQHSISANRKKSFTITTVSQSNVGNKNVGHKTGISDFHSENFQGRRKTTLYPRSHYQTNSRSRRKWNMIFFILKIPLIVFFLWLVKASCLYITASFANMLVFLHAF